MNVTSSKIMVIVRITIVCILFNLKSIKDIDKISDLVSEEGTTEVKININGESNDIEWSWNKVCLKASSMHLEVSKT